MSTEISRELFVERTKLTANAFDRASTVAFTVGVFTPTAALTFGVEPFAGVLAAWHAVTVSSWFLCGLLLHWAARETLKALDR